MGWIPLEHRVPRLDPFELGGACGPECLVIACRVVVNVGRRDERLRLEVVGGWEFAVFVKKDVDVVHFGWLGSLSRERYPVLHGTRQSVTFRTHEKRKRRGRRHRKPGPFVRDSPGRRRRDPGHCRWRGTGPLWTQRCRKDDAAPDAGRASSTDLRHCANRGCPTSRRPERKTTDRCHLPPEPALRCTYRARERRVRGATLSSA